jgi:hypothetical protein
LQEGSLAELGELLAGAELPDPAEPQLAQRFAALLDLWARDQILTLRIDQDPADPTF